MSFGNQHFPQRSFGVVASIFLLAPVFAAAQTPVVEYAFDETSGTSVSDTSGNENNGTGNGTTWAAGQYDGAINFGNRDYATVPDSVTLDLTSQLTISAWIRPNRTGRRYRTIVSKGNNSNINYYFDIRSSGLSFGGLRGNGNFFESTGLGITRNTWQHIAVVYDTTATPDTRFYVNGVEVASGNAGDLQENNLPLRIGRATSGEQFRGRIDNLRIYDQALAASAVTTDMQTPVGNTPPPDTTAPVITGVVTTNTTETTTSIVWTTDEPATSNVDYGLTTGYGNTQSDGTLVLNHSVSLTGLTPGTTYSYQVRSADAAGNEGMAIDTFTTLFVDTESPTVPIGLTAIGTSPATISLSWNASTDNVAVTGYRLRRDGVAIATTTSTMYVDTALTPSTTYTYDVEAFDAAGNNSGFSAVAQATTAINNGENLSLINQTPNTWVRVSRGDVTAPLNIMSYSGGWFDGLNGQFCLFGGGHWDYSGNEVWCLDTGTLAWSELYAPDAIVQQGGNQGAYNNYNASFPGALFNPGGESITDANPGSRHTYDQLEFIPGVGAISWGGYVWGDSSTGWCNKCIDTWVFDFVSNDWEYLYDGSNPSPNYDAGVGASAYSTQNGLMYSVSEGETWTFNPSTNQWMQINTSGPFGIEATMEYDPNRNVLYYFGGRYPINTTLYEFNISTNTWTALSPSGTGPGSSAVFGPGMAFDTQSDVLAIFSGGTIWIYDPDLNSWQQLSTSGGPTSNDYVFGRFRYDPVNHGFWSHSWENGAHETWFYKYTAS